MYAARQSRALHCLHVGCFVTGTVFAPDRRLEDAAQIEALADLLSRGAAALTAG